MSNKKKESLWQRWEDEVKKFKNALKYPPPETTIRHWQRYLLFIFMQELSKNVLNENESFDSIIDRIIEVLQIGCGFKHVRFYQVIENDEDFNVLKLVKISKGHNPVKPGLLLKTKYGLSDDVDTYLSKKPLVVEDSKKLKLMYKDLLKIRGPHAAIPLLVEGNPYGLICADTVSPDISSEITHKVNYLEYKEHFVTFARTIMAAIENRNMFEQRYQQIKQFELVKRFNELIESETDKEKLLNSFMKHCVTLFGADGGDLKLYNRESKRLETFANYGEDVVPSEILKSTPKDISFSNLAFKNKKPLLIKDLPSFPLMKKNIEYYKKKGHKKYLEILKNRKSAIIVPLIKHTGEIYGILDLNSKNKNQFSEVDKENLMALASSVTYAVDKTQQLEQRDEFLNMQNKMLTMFKDALREAHCYECVLDIIRENCRRLLPGKKLEIVCIGIKDSRSNVLITPSSKCFKAKQRDCSFCFTKKKIVEETLNKREVQAGKNNLAIPIFLENRVIGVLYLQGKGRIVLTENEKRILAIGTSTAAILATTARDYEEKIKQSTAFYEAGRLSTKARDFREWFNPVMERVIDIIGRPNRNFHLVMVEEWNGEKKLFVRATSPFFIDGNEIPVEEGLLGVEVPLNNSLSGEIVQTKRSRIIFDVDKNKKLKYNDSPKIPYYEYDDRIKSQVGIPLKIKEGNWEKVIGVLIINSVIKNDFRDLDLEFHETIANYLATIIHNQQLYEERAKYQEELYHLDRSLVLQAFMKSFIHDITAPVQEIRSQINIMEVEGKANWKENLNQLEHLADKLLSSYGEVVKDFARPFSEPVTRDIREIIANSLETVEKTIGLGIPIKGNFWDSDINIECYSVFVEMAFRVIINNAIKYSKGLEPKKRYLKIDVKSNTSYSSVTIVFESSTIERIPSEKLDQIFKPFVRFSIKEQGQGLGLSLAFECINLHNGEIKAENVKGKSAVRFLITLPRILKIKKEFSND